MIMPYIIFIFKNTNILFANSSAVADIIINLHFDEFIRQFSLVGS